MSASAKLVNIKCEKEESCRLRILRDGVKNEVFTVGGSAAHLVLSPPTPSSISDIVLKSARLFFQHSRLYLSPRIILITEDTMADVQRQIQALSEEFQKLQAGMCARPCPSTMAHIVSLPPSHALTLKSKYQTSKA